MLHWEGKRPEWLLPKIVIRSKCGGYRNQAASVMATNSSQFTVITPVDSGHAWVRLVRCS
jgi:hypothetical protein